MGLSRIQFQPYPTALRIADRPFVDHLDPRRFKCGDQLDQRLDIAPNHRFASLHALDGWHRKSRQLCEGALIDPEQHPGGPQLCCRDHWPSLWNGTPGDIRRYLCMISNDVKMSINDISDI